MEACDTAELPQPFFICYYTHMRTITRDIVGGFIFSKDGYILLGKSASGLYSDAWLIPGGGIDTDESDLDALKREILEETGVDIADAKIVKLNGIGSGQSEKVLPETGERVMVVMNFHDFLVELPYPASEIDLIAGDDFDSPQWHAASELAALTFSAATKKRLTELNKL